MNDTRYSETLYQSIPSGAFETTLDDAKALRDREAGNAERWYQAAMPRVQPMRRPQQFDELQSGHVRQFGEFECGLDDEQPP